MIFHCNYGRMLYRFRNKARYWSKTPIFHTSLYLTCTAPCNCMLCSHQKYSTFVTFDPTQPIENCKISTQPNSTQPAGRQLWYRCTVRLHTHITTNWRVMIIYILPVGLLKILIGAQSDFYKLNVICHRHKRVQCTHYGGWFVGHTGELWRNG